MFLFHAEIVGEREDDAEMSWSIGILLESVGSSKEYEVMPAEIEGGLMRDVDVGGGWILGFCSGADNAPTKGTRFFVFRFAMRVFTPFEGCTTELARAGASTFISETADGDS